MATDNNNPIKYSDLVSPDDSITNLIKQLRELDATYTETLKGIKEEATQLAETLQKVSGATESGQKATKKAAEDTDRLAKAQKELAFAQSENGKKIAQLNLAKAEANKLNKLMIKLNQSAEGSYDRLSAQYSINKIRINAMTQAQRDEAEATEGLITKTREMYETMKKYQEETGKHQLNVGNYTEASDAIIAYSEKLKDALHLNNAFGKSLLAMGKGGEESKAAFAAVKDGAKALGKTLLTLMANPVFLAIAGIAAAGVAIKWWYDYNAGLVEATRLTQQFTGKQGDNLKAYRNQVQAIADTFNTDFKETLIASNAVAKQFGISADEALQLIQDGFVAGGDANGEFLDSLKEYPAYFREAGISAEQFVAIVAQTNKAGIFSDKGIDAIKEGNLRLREMTKATADALEGIGISSEKVSAELESGTKTTFQIMQEISQRLDELPDSAANVGTAIADIFGGAGEDAGLQYLRTLKDISTNLDDVKAQTGELGELQEKQLESQLELQNALSGLLDLTGGTFEYMTTSAKIFVNEGLTWLIKGIINAVNGMIEMYNKSILIRGAWQAVVLGFKNSADAIGNIINYITDMLQGAGNVVKGIFTLDWDTIKEGATQVAKAFPRLVEESIKDTKDNINEGIQALGKKIKPLTIPVKVETTGGTTAVAPVARKQIEKKVEEATEKVVENKKKEKKAVEDTTRKEMEMELRVFDQKQALAQSEFDLLRNSEGRKTRFRLRAEKERLKKILDLNRKYNTNISAEEVKTIQNTIAKIDQEIQQSKGEERGNDIYGLFGLNLDEGQKAAIDTSVQYAMAALMDFMDYRVQMADAAVASADKEVDSTQRVLDAELEARANGYANNVVMAQKELDMARKNQEKAIKDQKKAQQQQQAVQTIMQIGDMVTASALIWSQLGFPWAIPALAVMWASFATSKITAAAIARKQEKFGEGTVEFLSGGSHQSGDDVDLGTKPDGTQRRAEGGEFFAVINKRNSRRYRKIIPDVINSLNNGTFANKYMSAYKGADGLTLNIAGGSNPDLRNLSADVREIRDQNRQRSFVDGNGQTIITYKNLTRKIN